MSSISFDSKAPPTEKTKVPPSESTPFGLSSGGPVTHGKKNLPSHPLSFQVMVSSILLICFGLTAYTTHRSSLSAPSSSKNLYENDRFTITSLIGSESVMDSTSVSLLDEEVEDLFENDSSSIFSTTSLTGSELDTDTGSVSLSYEENDNKLTTNTENEQPGLLSAARLYPEFPSGVFEYTAENVANGSYMRQIGNRCSRSSDKNMDQELACLMYFQNADISAKQVPIALGTLKTKADITKIISNGELKQGDVSLLFEDYALAALIDRGCFMWSTGNGLYKSSSYSYITEEDYARAATKSASTDVSGSGSYWGVTVSVGYEGASSDSSSDSGKTRTAFGERKYSAPVGTIRNTCFQNKRGFREEIKDLVKPEWVARWARIRSATTVDEVLALGDDFEKVADGGFFIPTRYNYEVMIAYTMTTKYTSFSTSSTKSASNAITAGLDVDFATVSGSVETAIKQEAEKASSVGGYTSIVDVKTSSSGNGLDVECVYKTEGVGACSTVIVAAVADIRSDITKLGEFPMSQSVLLPLDKLIQWYFDDDDVGLPEVFRQAVKRRYPDKPVFVPTCSDFGGIDSPSSLFRCCLSSCGDKCGGAGAYACASGDKCCYAEAVGRVCGTDPLPCLKSTPTCSDFGGIGSPSAPLNRCCHPSCGDKCGGAGAGGCGSGDKCCYDEAVGRVCGRDPLPCFM